MSLFARLFAVLILALGVSGPAAAQIASPSPSAPLEEGGSPAPTGDPYGAVLCSYAFVVEVRSFQQECRSDNETTGSALDALRLAHRDFVGRNQPATGAQLDSFEVEHDPFENTETLCTDGDLKALYADFEDNLSDYQADIMESLLVDRTPIWDPCL